MSTQYDDTYVPKKEYTIYEEGLYQGEVLSVEKTTGNFGDQIKMTFRLLNVDNDDAKISGWCSFTYTEKSKLYRWNKALLADQFNPEDDFFGKKLIGKRALLLLGLRRSAEGSDFNKIEDVLRLSEVKIKTPTQPMQSEAILTDLGYDTVTVTEPSQPPIWD